MDSKNTGKDFEKLVERIFTYMYSNYHGSKIKHDVLLASRYGNRQFDVVITMPIPDGELITVIEAKDYKSRISISKIDEFHSKMMDVRASKGIFISKNGFSTAAISKAKDLGIELYSLNDHQYFNDFKFKVPVLIQEIKPFDVDIRQEIKKEELKKLPEKVYAPEDSIINGSKLFEAINKDWETNNLNFNVAPGQQRITLNSLIPPYKMTIFDQPNFLSPIEITLDKLEILMRLQFRYFLCDIRDIMEEKILKNVHQNGIRFFLNTDTLDNAISNMDPVSPTFVKNFTGSKLVIQIKSTSQLAPAKMKFNGKDLKYFKPN